MKNKHEVQLAICHFCVALISGVLFHLMSAPELLMRGSYIHLFMLGFAGWNMWLASKWWHEAYTNV
jgi:hypothetical protein